ncbi:hypothetical protein ACFOOK_03785 [Micromonospora krabiensis]|uniref:hypothetical protein n=1 Tax=Micromonospora krabiensis TaxID=307121 RepID=UPI000AC3EC85|nr:hypothetical protein [Micromonospora krabiensis]
MGVVAAPGAATDLARQATTELADRLRNRVPEVDWAVRLQEARLVDGPADLSQLVEAARRRMLAEGWSLVLCVTDLPLQTARRPVVAHASTTHGVAVLSMPALGPVAVARRMAEAGDRLLAALLGDTDAVGDQVRAGPRRWHPAAGRRARELGAQVDHQTSGIGLLAGVVGGNLRLLLGMLRANRPWRLAIRLSRLLVGAFATAVLALVSADIWQLSAALGNLRLALLAAGSILAVVLTMVLGARLWERVPHDPSAREQVVLFNTVTVLTVVIGVLALYVALAALTIIGAIALVPWDLLAESTGRPAGVAHQVKLGWLASSLATVGGALGAGLESDSAVQEAAYRYQPDRELTGEQGGPDPTGGTGPRPHAESRSPRRDRSEAQPNHEAD